MLVLEFAFALELDFWRGFDPTQHKKKIKQSGVLITFNSKTACLQYVMYFKSQLTDAPLR